MDAKFEIRGGALRRWGGSTDFPAITSGLVAAMFVYLTFAQTGVGGDLRGHDRAHLGTKLSSKSNKRWTFFYRLIHFHCMLAQLKRHNSGFKKRSASSSSSRSPKDQLSLLFDPKSDDRFS